MKQQQHKEYAALYKRHKRMEERLEATELLMNHYKRNVDGHVVRRTDMGKLIEKIVKVADEFAEHIEET